MKPSLRLTSEKLNQIALFLILLAAYLYFFPRWADPNQNSRLNMVVAVVEDGTFKIDKYVENTVDYAKVGDHYYSDKAPGTAFVGIPAYAALKVALDSPLMDSLIARLSNNQAFQSTLRADGSGILEQKVRFALAQVLLTWLVAALPTAVMGVLLYSAMGQFTDRAGPRIAVVLGYGLLTPAFAYAGAFYGHQLSAALLFAAFYLAFVYKERLTPGWLLLIGLMLGYSVVTEYPTALVVIILYLYIFFVLWQQQRRLQIGWVTLSGGMVALVWMGYNTYIFGGPLELGYSYSELWVDQHETGFMSLTLPRPEPMWGITFGVFRGLFVLSPWLLLAIPGFWLWYRYGKFRAEWLVVVLISLTIFLFNASSAMWWGGFAIGPRYLLPALPFFAMPVVFVLSRWGAQGWLKGLALLLFSWSLLATWGLTLAEQAFPPDTIRNPLLQYALPNWLAGNIARNVGTILGFGGGWSLLPLLVILTILSAGWWFLNRRLKTISAPPAGLSPQSLSTPSSSAAGDVL